MCYAQRYHKVLETGNASAIVNIQSGAIRRHAMEALAAHAKFSGYYDRWQQIRQRYSLHWINGDESVQALQRFFNPDLSLDKMIQRIKEMICLLPPFMGQIVRFGCLVGLRPLEVVESVRLLNNIEVGTTRYYNPERQALEHFRFPEIFIRQTKKAYISFVTSSMIESLASFSFRVPTYNYKTRLQQKRDDMRPSLLS